MVHSTVVSSDGCDGVLLKNVMQNAWEDVHRTWCAEMQAIPLANRMGITTEVQWAHVEELHTERGHLLTCHCIVCGEEFVGVGRIMIFHSDPVELTAASSTDGLPEEDWRVWLSKSLLNLVMNYIQDIGVLLSVMNPCAKTNDVDVSIILVKLCYLTPLIWCAD